MYKPDIALIGERLLACVFAEADALASRTDLMLVLGTSLSVHPAASLPERTLMHGGRLIIVNGDPTPLDSFAMLRFKDSAEFSEAVLAVF